MAPKHPFSDPVGPSLSKKPHKGFSVGPAHLPDGTHRRKVQKIKKDLIHKAKLKRSYAKLKSREPPATNKPPIYTRSSLPPSPSAEPSPSPAHLDLHPARRAMLDTPPAAPDAHTTSTPVGTVPPHLDPTTPSHPPRTPPSKKPKPIPFEKEARDAQRKREEAETRRAEIEAARKERERKRDERERFRSAMAKARTGGRNGQRKLGRESRVLLERVRRVVGAG